MSTPLAKKAPKDTELDVNAWHRWHDERIEQATRADGPPALTGTHWVTATDPSSAEHFPGAPGQWYTTDNSIVGINLDQPVTTTGIVQLHLGEKIDSGQVILSTIYRRGQFALRTFDQSARSRVNFRTIATFRPAQEWRLPARFEEDVSVVDIVSADGTVNPTETAGWVYFNVDGRERRLLATDNGESLRVVFSDRSKDEGVHRFRFLDIKRPLDNGTESIVDFNRAFLPPLAFSPHFLCPSPTASNHVDISIDAGEKWPVFER